MPGDREKCLEAGCDEYDTKPIDFARLMEKIQAQLDKKPTA
jgi:CheY-like chemotaxis protein